MTLPVEKVLAAVSLRQTALAHGETAHDAAFLVAASQNIACKFTHSNLVFTLDRGHKCARKRIVFKPWQTYHVAIWLFFCIRTQGNTIFSKGGDAEIYYRLFA